MSDDRGSKDNPSGKAVSGTSGTATGGSTKVEAPKATTLPPVDKLASARKTLIGLSGPPSGAPPAGAGFTDRPKSKAPMRPSVPSGPTPPTPSTAPKFKPQSIRPPAQAHEADDWDADEATTIFNPKAMLEAARNASKSQSKADSTSPAPSRTPVTPAPPNDSAELTDALRSSQATVSPTGAAEASLSAASPASASPAGAAGSAPPARDASIDASVANSSTRDASIDASVANSSAPRIAKRESNPPDDRESAVSSNPAAHPSSRVGSHAEKTSPSTRAFAAVQRASATRADRYVWIGAGVFVIAGAWFALSSGPDTGAKLQPATRAPVPASSEPSSTRSPSNSAAPVASRGLAPVTSRSSDAKRTPERDVVATTQTKTSSNDLVVVTVVASPAQARFYYKGKP
ncbi:MAG TPA: hypothetical protein VKP30_27095, partial [Polyangiaceae bacterium]|nr:hypothetical protein [Polyangiaceae bacterium]